MNTSITVFKAVKFFYNLWLPWSITSSTCIGKSFQESFFSSSTQDKKDSATKIQQMQNAFLKLTSRITGYVVGFYRIHRIENPEVELPRCTSFSNRSLTKRVLVYKLLYIFSCGQLFQIGPKTTSRTCYFCSQFLSNFNRKRQVIQLKL